MRMPRSDIYKTSQISCLGMYGESAMLLTIWRIYLIVVVYCDRVLSVGFYHSQPQTRYAHARPDMLLQSGQYRTGDVAALVRTLERRLHQCLVTKGVASIPADMESLPSPYLASNGPYIAPSSPYLTPNSPYLAPSSPYLVARAGQPPALLSDALLATRADELSSSILRRIKTIMGKKEKAEDAKTGKSYWHASKPKITAPTVTLKKLKKSIFTHISKGSYIPGGTQAYGIFKTVKDCMKLCAMTGSCLAGDYDPWLEKCYIHDYRTVCNMRNSHAKTVHFSKIPCDVDVVNARTQLSLNSQLPGGIFQKGLENLQDCLKKCASAGNGIADTPADLLTTNNGGQYCFGIDFDFGTHKCYFFTRLFTTFAPVTYPTPGSCVLDANGDIPNPIPTVTVFVATDPICPTDNADLPVLTTLEDNPTVIHITICPDTT